MLKFLRLIIQRIDIKMANIINKLQFKEFGINVGSSTNICGKIYISMEKLASSNVNEANISIGNNCTINSGWKYNLIGEGLCTILRTIDGGKIRINNYVGMSNVCIVSFEEVEIEDYVTIGGGVHIYDSDFHSLDFLERTTAPFYYGIKSKKVHIKRGAFIGAGAYILKGVTVGENSIVGAGSVVVKDVPSGEIWAGNPAKFIKQI